MQLYFRPFACSLATRIALIETGQDADFRLVERTKTVAGGGDYRDVNSLGYVPALDIGEDEVLTENPAVLQYVAETRPEAGLLPPVGSSGRYRTLQWLSFIATEVHSKIFTALLTPDAPEGAKVSARQHSQTRLARLSKHLEGREFLTDAFSIADCYLIAVLNWFETAGVDIKAWPALEAYRSRLRRRPSVAQAMGEELPLLHAY